MIPLDLAVPAEEQSHNEVESFVMPSTYYTPVDQMHNFIDLLMRHKDEEKEKIWVVKGPKGAGKSCFVKKVSHYYFNRIKKNSEFVYKDWIYVDLHRYQSLLHLLAGCSIHRDRRVYQTLEEVVEYAKERKCFFVLDHCNSIASASKKEFFDMIREQIRKKLESDSKLIVVFETDSALE